MIDVPLRRFALWLGRSRQRVWRRRHRDGAVRARLCAWQESDSIVPYVDRQAARCWHGGRHRQSSRPRRLAAPVSRQRHEEPAATRLGHIWN